MFMTMNVLSPHWWFEIKISQLTGNKRKFPYSDQKKKKIYIKNLQLTSQNDEQLNAFPPKISTKIKMLALNNPIQNSMVNFSQYNKARKENIGKEEVKLHLFLNNLIVYVKNQGFYIKTPIIN